MLHPILRAANSLLFPLVLFLFHPHLSQAADQTPLEVRIYSSVTPGIKTQHAVAFTKPAVDLLSRQINYPMTIDVEEQKSLLQLGKDLNEGKTHIGIVWGLEYGWLRQKYPELKIMAVATQGGAVGISAQLLVRKNFQGQNAGDLKGKRLATYRRAPMMITRYRNKVVRDSGHDLKTFFESITTFETPKGAILALKAGGADVVEIDGMAWARFGQVQPGGKNTDMKPFISSDAFPEAVIIGRADMINLLRSDLWKALQTKLWELHLTPEGKQCTEFWGVDSYNDPDAHDMYQLIDRSLQTYPFLEEK